MKSLRLTLVAWCAFSSVCTAQFIPGVTTTTSMGTWFSYNIANLTNGVGLSAMTLTATHSANWQDMWISNQITTGWLQFDLGAVVQLGGIVVWNYNSSISLARGVQLMNVSTSTDGLTFTPPSAVTVPQGTAQPIPGYLIGTGAVAARYVKFDILSNYGDTYTGLSDVQFLAGAGSVVATNTTLGQGCIRAASSFYEFFSSSASFDLSNSAISMVYTGSGYIVLPGMTAYVPPSGAATTLALTDDSDVSVALSSTFPYAGGTTSSLRVCSNGFVSVAAGNGTAFTPDVATMLAAPQTAWWNWHDYNPAAAGSGQVKYEQIGGIAYVTWDGVYDYGGTSAANANTFQFQFETGTGFVHLVFGSLSTLGNARLVGYSPGGPSIDPGNTDLSAAVPATFSIGAADILPLTLAGGSRPVIGNSWTLNVTNVPATGTLGIDVFGLSDPNIPDLGFLGAPGCGTRASLDLLNVWIVAGATHNYSLLLPNSPALVNLHVYTQALVLQPGVNTLLGGVITSNGIDGLIGDL
ncbi:MAG TPA: discoidin domain-containing protein [Planctomycetota bacterium]|nr:discoidin domain-containing protein [Planctomycetota bacterium]